MDVTEIIKIAEAPALVGGMIYAIRYLANQQKASTEENKKFIKEIIDDKKKEQSELREQIERVNASHHQQVERLLDSAKDERIQMLSFVNDNIVLVREESQTQITAIKGLYDKELERTHETADFNQAAIMGLIQEKFNIEGLDSLRKRDEN